MHCWYLSHSKMIAFFQNMLFFHLGASEFIKILKIWINLSPWGFRRSCLHFSYNNINYLLVNSNKAAVFSYKNNACHLLVLGSFNCYFYSFVFHLKRTSCVYWWNLTLQLKLKTRKKLGKQNLAIFLVRFRMFTLRMSIWINFKMWAAHFSYPPSNHHMREDVMFQIGFTCGAWSLFYYLLFSSPFFPLLCEI